MKRHPKNRAKPRFKYAQVALKTMLAEANEFNQEDKTMRTLEQLKDAAKKALEEFFPTATQDEATKPTEKEIKNVAVRKIFESQSRLKAMVEEEKLYQEQVALEAINMLNEVCGYKLTADEPFDWFSDDDLINVGWVKSMVAVTNEYFLVAETEFLKMVDKYGLEKDAKLAPWIEGTKQTFKLTNSGKINERKVRELKKLKIDIKTMPEWLLVKGYLDEGIEYHNSKMSLSISARQSPKHDLKKIYF